jgi:cation transport regulator ChaB
MAEEAQFDAAGAHRYFSAACFNKAWEYLDKTDRTSDDDQRMIETTLASVWHWTQRPDCTDTNLSIGYWQASRVYATVGSAAEAYRYGELCLKASQVEGMPPFYLGYAYEALARAALVMGDRAKMGEHLSQARRVADTVPDLEARKALVADLDTLE